MVSDKDDDDKVLCQQTIIPPMLTHRTTESPATAPLSQAAVMGYYDNCRQQLSRYLQKNRQRHAEVDNTEGMQRLTTPKACRG